MAQINCQNAAGHDLKSVPRNNLFPNVSSGNLIYFSHVICKVVSLFTGYELQAHYCTSKFPKVVYVLYATPERGPRFFHYIFPVFLLLKLPTSVIYQLYHNKDRRYLFTFSSTYFRRLSIKDSTSKVVSSPLKSLGF